MCMQMWCTQGSRWTRAEKVFPIAMHVLLPESVTDAPLRIVDDARWAEVFLRCFVATMMRIILHNYSCVYDNTNMPGKVKGASDTASKKTSRAMSGACCNCMNLRNIQDHYFSCIYSYIDISVLQDVAKTISLGFFHDIKHTLHLFC